MLSAPQGWCHERECIICDHCAPDISRHGRHGRDSHPVAFAANLPAGCKNYRAAPAGFPRCGTCNIYIGDAFVGKHFSNRRHIYLRGIAKQKDIQDMHFLFRVHALGRILALLAPHISLTIAHTMVRIPVLQVFHQHSMHHPCLGIGFFAAIL